MRPGSPFKSCPRIEPKLTLLSFAVVMGWLIRTSHSYCGSLDKEESKKEVPTSKFVYGQKWTPTEIPTITCFLKADEICLGRSKDHQVDLRNIESFLKDLTLKFKLKVIDTESSDPDRMAFKILNDNAKLRDVSNWVCVSGRCREDFSTVPSAWKCTQGNRPQDENQSGWSVLVFNSIGILAEIIEEPKNNKRNVTKPYDKPASSSPSPLGPIQSIVILAAVFGFGAPYLNLP